MTLADLLARRAVLLERCRKVDSMAGNLRERDMPLDIFIAAGFEAHDELRVVEHQIAKLREPRR